MGSPDKRCGLCRLYRRGRPPGIAVEDWAPQHGTCLRDEEPQPTHANCRACKKYSQLFPLRGVTMRLRALIIDDKAKAEVERVSAHANKHRITKRVLHATLSGEIAPAGEAPGYTCYLSDGFKVVFSIEEQGPTGWCRHLSVSVDGDRYPGVEAVNEIASMFGFTKPLAECMVWTEDHAQAVNVLQPIDLYIDEDNDACSNL